jgi:hypothetical protein
MAADPVPDNFMDILRIDKQAVAIHQITIGLCKPINYMRNGIRGKQKIVRMQQADHIAGSYPHTFVNGFVHPVIRFRDNLVYLRLILIDKRQGIIGGSTINHYVFNIGIILAQDALNGIPNGFFAVVTRGDEGDFHACALIEFTLKDISSRNCNIK